MSALEGAPNSVGADQQKRIANVRARLALAGHELHVVSLPDGRHYFEVRRWQQARMISSIAGVEAFAIQVGAS